MISQRLIAKLEDHRNSLLKELQECESELLEARGEDAGRNLVVPASEAIRDIPPLRWLVPGLIPAVGWGLLSSVPYVGKSLLSAFMAGSISSGRPMFGGFKPVAPVPVLYVYLESSKAEFLWVVRKTLESRGIDGKNLYVRAQHTRASEFKIGSQNLEAAIRGSGAKFVVIDTLAFGSAAGSEKNEDLQAKVVEPMVELSDRYQCFILALHHAQKATMDVDPVYQHRGGSVLSGAADTLYRLVRVKGEPHDSKLRQLHIDKVRGSVSGEMVLEYDFDRRVAFTQGQDIREVLWTPERYEKFKATHWEGEA